MGFLKLKFWYIYIGFWSFFAVEKTVMNADKKVKPTEEYNDKIYYSITKKKYQENLIKTKKNENTEESYGNAILTQDLMCNEKLELEDYYEEKTNFIQSKVLEYFPIDQQYQEHLKQIRINDQQYKENLNQTRSQIRINDQKLQKDYIDEKIKNCTITR